MTEELVLPEGGTVEPSRHITDLTNRLIQSLDVAESSRATYRRGLNCFIRWVMAEGIQTPTRDDIIAYKKGLQEQGKSPYSIALYITCVRRLYSWAESMQLGPNLARDIKGAKKPRGFRKDPLTREQVRQLLGAIDTAGLEGKRDAAMISLMLLTGLRGIAVTRANLEDIRQQSGETLLWVQEKGRLTTDECKVLTPSCLTPLLTYLNARGENDGKKPLFASMSDRNHGGRLTTRSVRRIIKTRLRAAGLSGLRLSGHSLRHTTATLYLVAGGTVQGAKMLMGHTSVDMTLRYAHNLDRIGHAPERLLDEYLSAAEGCVCP